MGLNQALLDACTAQGLLAAIAAVPDNAGGRPYAVIWPDGPVRTATALADSYGERTTVFIFHCMGKTEEATEIAEEKIAAAVRSLYGQVIDGQQVTAPVQDWSAGFARDDDTAPALYDKAASWRLRTTPA